MRSRLLWTGNGLATQTNALPASTNLVPRPVHFIANFGVGTHQVGLSLTDSNAPAVTCSTTVTVQDTTPPEIRKLTATPNILWVPNHKMVAIKLTVMAVDACGPVTSKILSVTSNEPQSGLGDGDTADDWKITGALGLSLRAERSGKGNGRTYTITIQAADAIGNTSTGQVTVTVPHSKGKSNGK